MRKIDIREWVGQSNEQRVFREAVHTILFAVSSNQDLQANMTMKGGILLAIGYESSRYTKDIDFSTSMLPGEFDLKKFIDRLNNSLTLAVERLEYGLDCVVQSCRQQPPREDATFPTIRVKIGYAYKSDLPAHRRLLRRNSSQIVQIDYSLNEPPGEPETIQMESGHSIQIYSFHDLVAEKFRALLQQEVRNRFRRQDIYDLHLLLIDHPLGNDQKTKEKILSSLTKKAAARDLAVSKESMQNSEIRRRSERDYKTLEKEVEGDLPKFEFVYESVEVYYEGLPWDSA